MIQSFQVINENQDAFYLTIMFQKKTGVQELKKDAMPEGMAKIQNIEELLNGIKDFTEGQKKLMALVVPYLNSWKMWLATDLDKDTVTKTVSHMTTFSQRIRVSHVFVVGMEDPKCDEYEYQK
jgi:DNA helicase-2/ATP-dependent DNA helicase PcrA